jgi:hypothetical protein
VCSGKVWAVGVDWARRRLSFLVPRWLFWRQDAWHYGSQGRLLWIMVPTDASLIRVDSAASSQHFRHIDFLLSALYNEDNAFDDSQEYIKDKL